MIRIIEYSREHEKIWDEYCIRNQALFQFTRKFLNYHPENKFKDSSIILLEEDQVIGLFPAAITDDRVFSHPGLGYGGLVVSENTSTKMFGTLLGEVVRHFESTDCKELVIKHKPFFYNSGIDAIEEYFLNNGGFKLHAYELNSLLDLRQEWRMSSRKKRNIKKFRGSVDIEDSDSIAEVYSLIVNVLEKHHSVTPTHSLEELRYLVESFPDEIAIYCARLDGVIVAASIVFEYGDVWHTQYVASGDLGRQFGALDALIFHVMKLGRDKEVRYLSFGSSTEKSGEILNESLFQYKREFGCIPVLRNTYIRELR